MFSIHKNPNMLFGALQSFFWSAMCLTCSFLALYLESRGYDKEQIGQLFAISALSLMLGQYVWGAYCYKHAWLSHKHIILFNFCIAIVCNFLFFYISSPFWVLILLFSIFTFTLSSMAPMIDAWTMFRKLDTPQMNYGLTRGMGSVAYALIVIGFGYIFRYLDIQYIFIFSSIFIFLGIIVTVRIHRGRPENSFIVSQIAGIGAAKSLLINKRFMIFILSIFFVFMAYMSNLTFYGLLIKELGGSSREFGQGFFIATFFQLPVMLLTVWLLKKYSAHNLLLFAFLCLLINTLTLTQADSLVVAILSQVFVSISFGIFIPVSINYLTQIVRQSEVTVGIMVMNAITFGLSGMIGNTLGGMVSQRLGLFVMYEVNAYLMLVGLLLFAGSSLFLKPLLIKPLTKP